MQGIRVLLVEDNWETRLLLRAYLETLGGITVCGEAGDGQRGLELIRNLAPDLVLLDLVMPVMSGTGLLRALREDPPPRRPRIIVLSHMGEDSLVRYTNAQGVDYHMTKPVNMDELVELIHCFCQNEKGGEEEEELACRARWLLLRMGAAENSLGFRCAALTARELARNPGILLKEAYGPAMNDGPVGRSSSNVEKNIRDLVGRLHTAACPEYIALMGGLPPRRPDNRTFLNRLADAVRRGEGQGGGDKDHR